MTAHHTIKEHYVQRRADAIKRYRRRPRAARLLHRLSHAADEALQHLKIQHPLPDGAACLALGGYGRQELYPYSDVDLLLLLQAPACPADQRRIEAFIAACWDLGLPISHTVQTPAQCLSLSRRDIRFQTALLEARFLMGQQDLWQQLQLQHQQQICPAQFFQAKRAEMTARHAHYQNTPYALEPNCKESPGGLRDLHLLAWLARVAGLGNNWSEIALSGLLTAAEQKALQRVSQAFMRLRIELHLLTQRAEDTLRFDLQPQLAARYGFVNPNPERPASELLMQRYYWAARLVSQLSTTLMQSLAEQLLPAPKTEIRSIDEHFAVVNRRLKLKNGASLPAHPENLLRAFLLWQQHPETLGFDAMTLRSIWHGRKLVDTQFRQRLRHKKLFIEILQQPRRVYECLQKLNLFNILPRYIPAFRAIVGQMQHDLFHVYTVDQHSLIVIRNLCVLSQSAKQHSLAQQLMSSFPRPYVLYLAALFHDIAKGRSGDHAQLGANIAWQFCHEHELPAQDRQLIHFLVREHLLFSHYAQKKDYHDPAVLQQFIERVDTVEKLQALYLLTVADIQATNPAIWTSWKASLLEGLYQSAYQRLQRHDHSHQFILQERKALLSTELEAVWQQAPPALDFWHSLDEDYFARYPQATIAWHIKSLAPQFTNPTVALRPVVEVDPDTYWQVMAYTQDRPELFMTLCQVFERLDCAIHDAQIYTHVEGWVIDTFVVKPGLALHTDPHGPALLIHELKQALSVNKPREQHPFSYRDERSKRAQVFPIAPRVSLTALDDGHWSLNLVGTDRKGLLFDLAKIFAQWQLNLRSAKIMTLGERVEDSFVFKAEQLQDAQTRQQLIKAIVTTLS